MNEQNFANHARFVKGFHLLLGALLILGTLAAITGVVIQWTANYDLMNPILITVLFISCLLLFWYTRQFPIKAQDRAIRAEEHLRYFIITGKAMDSRVTMEQVIALRFAPDDEFVTLTARAINENLSSREIKKEIRKWRADNHRA